MLRTLTLVPLLAAAVLCSGCIYSHEIARTRRDIERQYPEADFDRQMVLSLGRGTMGFVAWLADASDDADAERAAFYLREIDRVKVGVYRVENLPSLDDLDLSRLDRLKRRGWELAVKTKEHDESVWVMYRGDDEDIRNLFVFVLSDEELVVAKLEGNLSNLFRRVMEDEGHGIADVFDNY